MKYDTWNMVKYTIKCYLPSRLPMQLHDVLLVVKEVKLGDIIYRRDCADHPEYIMNWLFLNFLDRDQGLPYRCIIIHVFSIA